MGLLVYISSELYIIYHFFYYNYSRNYDYDYHNITAIISYMFTFDSVTTAIDIKYDSDSHKRYP